MYTRAQPLPACQLCHPPALHDKWKFYVLLFEEILCSLSNAFSESNMLMQTSQCQGHINLSEM